LSLALALADSLSELSTEPGRFSLDSLFLDEGFSTLDPETLDVVAQTVEALGGGDRLVGIISHIPELAERFLAQIEVKKAIGGSTIVVKHDGRPISTQTAVAV
jgi:exonuclease SbcC